MKLKFSFVILFSCLISFNIGANTFNQNQQGAENSKTIRCGTNLSTKAYAYKENGKWRGFDVDICKTFAWALLGDGSKFEMIDVRAHEIESALKDHKIDIMLSNNVNQASIEAKQRASEVGLLYYDRQMFATKDAPDNISSMQDFKSKKVCVFAGSDYLENLKAYNDKYKLGFKIMAYKSLRKARNAFLLKHCELFSMQGLLLQAIIKDSPGKNLLVLPEEFADKPVYAYVSPFNNKMRVLAKWVINSLYAAESMGLTKENANEFIYEHNTDNANLFGENDLLWKLFNVHPDWLRLAVADVGNMGEIFERNLGLESDYKLKRGKAALVQNGGTVSVIPFK